MLGLGAWLLDFYVVGVKNTLPAFSRHTSLITVHSLAFIGVITVSAEVEPVLLRMGTETASDTW